MDEKASRSPSRVIALVYDGIQAFELGVVLELFGRPRPELDRWYDFSMCAVDPSPVRGNEGFLIEAEHGLERLDDADTIVVPGWRDLDAPVPDELLQRLRAAC